MDVIVAGTEDMCVQTHTHTISSNLFQIWGLFIINVFIFIIANIFQVLVLGPT